MKKVERKLENLKNFETLQAFLFTSGITGKSYWKIWECSTQSALHQQFNSKEELESFCDANFVGRYV